MTMLFVRLPCPSFDIRLFTNLLFKFLLVYYPRLDTMDVDAARRLKIKRFLQLNERMVRASTSLRAC